MNPTIFIRDKRLRPGNNCPVMGDLAKKDDPQPIQPARPTAHPVETRRVEHVIIPPPGGLGGLGGFGPPQSVPIPPPQPGAPASQTIIYINAAPAPAQPAAPAPPQQPVIQPKVMQYTGSQDARPRGPIRHQKGLSILGLAGFALGIAAIYLRFKPYGSINPLYVAYAGAGLAVLGFLSAITSGRSRAGVPFLAMLLCGGFIAYELGWVKRATDEAEKRGYKLPIDSKELAPKPLTPSIVPATLPAAQPKPIEPATTPVVPPVPSPAVSVVPATVPAFVPPTPPVDSATQAREAVEAAQKKLKTAQDRALAAHAEYQEALVAETVTAKDRDAARQSGVGLQDAARKHLDAQSLVTKLRRDILANDPAVKTAEQALAEAQRKLKP